MDHEYSYDLNGNRTNAVYGVSGRTVSWTYDALNRITQISEGTNTTSYYYDLNSKPLWRVYPSGVWEARTFDAMGRLLTMSTHGTDNNMMFDMTYEYDLVGSALKMTQTSADSLTNHAPEAVTTWTYDDRYRLTSETVRTAGILPATNTTAYAWDAADNRYSMIEYTNGVRVSSTYYSNNNLNQMKNLITFFDDGSTPDVAYFAYDANGSRTNASRTVGGTTSSSSYTYDEDNRLTAVALDAPTNTHTFAYDYRSRRYYRSTPSTPHMYCVFDGGLSIQEYTVSGRDDSPQSSALTTEFIRGEGMGGGVGGMVYSIKTNGTVTCSHANHRGDVIARTDESGTLTSFALYEAYGTRPYEWGDDPDRQKANTKEEESDLGLLNEGMRFRDLETGVFLTRDPIRYQDGPNMYCYVHCNPITHFDAFGLRDMTDDEKDDADTLSNQADEMDKQAEEMRDQADALNEEARNATDLKTATQKNKEAEDLRGQADKLSSTASNLRDNIKEWKDAVGDVKDGHADPAYVTAMSTAASAWAGYMTAGSVDTVTAPDGTQISKPAGVNMDTNAKLASEMTPFQWRDLVTGGGMWDYKQLGDPLFEPFGNFHYGVTGKATGIPEGTLLREAGRFQLKSENHGPGRPPLIPLSPVGGKAPFGDFQNDQDNIKRGFGTYNQNYSRQPSMNDYHVPHTTR